MADTNSSDSPLDAVAETVGERTVEAFELLGDETRLAVLLALWEAKEPGAPAAEPSEPGLPFSELYDRVGATDSGNFNYHLGKLVGRFVEQTDEGYTLTTRAEQVLGSVFAGTLADASTFEGEPTDGECYRCGEPMVIDYSDGLLTERCTNCEGVWQRPDDPPGLITEAYRPPVGLENRTPREFHRYGNVRDRHRRFSMMGGACPNCSGKVATGFHVCEDHDAGDRTLCDHCGSIFEIQSLFVCEVCKFAWVTPAFAAIFTDMGVKAFFYDHGLDHDELFDASRLKEIRDAVERVTVTAEDPMELQVAVELDGDRLDVTLDDEARVVDVTEAE